MKDYWQKTADFDEHRIALRDHLAESHGVHAMMTCTPSRIVTMHLTEHHKPGAPTDWFFPYPEGE